MSVDYIRETYRVPAKVGGRVRYSGGETPTDGVIVGAKNAHLRIRIDGDKFNRNFHPTWKMEYLEDKDQS